MLDLTFVFLVHDGMIDSHLSMSFISVNVWVTCGIHCCHWLQVG